jgi:hypothetical protein
MFRLKEDNILPFIQIDGCGTEKKILNIGMEKKKRKRSQPSNKYMGYNKINEIIQNIMLEKTTKTEPMKNTEEKIKGNVNRIIKNKSQKLKDGLNKNGKGTKKKKLNKIDNDDIVEEVVLIEINSSYRSGLLNVCSNCWGSSLLQSLASCCEMYIEDVVNSMKNHTITRKIGCCLNYLRVCCDLIKNIKPTATSTVKLYENIRTTFSMGMGLNIQ